MSKRMPEEEPPGPEEVRVSYRRRYGAVLAEALLEAFIEESKLENNPNGAAGIPPWGRVIRVGVKSVSKFMHQNSINKSKSLGAKWEVVTPRKLFTDTGCEICKVPFPEET